MNTREWALIIFTILGQLSVGTFLVLLIVRAYLSQKSGVEQAAKLTDLPLYGVVATMGLALIASLFHLGKVMHVVGAVPNLATSWMSREVVSSVIFMVLVFLFAVLEWRKIGSEGLRLFVAWLGAIVGLVLLFSMSMTYMLPAEPAWDSLATPILFFAAALLLGVLGSAAALVASHTAAGGQQLEPLGAIMRGLSIAAIILLGVELVVTPIYMAWLSLQGAAALKSLSLMTWTYGPELFIRLALVFIGAGFLAVHLFRNASVADNTRKLTTLAYSSFVLVLASEVLGRFLFYATHIRIGV